MSNDPSNSGPLPPGVTMRDWFAAQIMSKCFKGRSTFAVLADLNGPTTGFGRDVVATAYRMADLALAVRQERPSK